MPGGILPVRTIFMLQSSPTIITDNQLALLSQTLLLLFMLCCMTFTFASCKYFVQSVFQR